MEVLFLCVVLGRLEKVFGNKVLCVCVCILLCYAVNALDLALESIRILFGLEVWKLKHGNYVCVLMLCDLHCLCGYVLL